jgi:polyisoprenoid-binding protein YceI
MSKLLRVSVLVAIIVAAVPALAADDYTVDPAHAGVTFRISHVGLSWIPGRFNVFSGSFAIDPDPSKCSFTLNIKTDSIDTNNAARDKHLRSGDFFNVNQFSTIAFQSTSVKPIKDGYEVSGNLTMHGVTKSITFPLLGGRKTEFPKGVERTGYSTELILKRSEFGIDKFLEMLGDDVHIGVSFEGTKNKK